MTNTITELGDGANSNRRIASLKKAEAKFNLPQLVASAGF